MLSRELSTRILSGFLSLSLHVAAGVALFWAWDEGVPERDRSSGDSGTDLVVELVSTDRESGPDVRNPAHGGDASSQDIEPVPPMKPGEEGHAEPVERAAGLPSDDAPATAAVADEARELADLPNADVLAYRQRLEAHLARYRIYPQAARDAGREGVVMLHFVMTQDGRILEAWVGESSGVSDIDREAVAAVLRAQPLPSFPQGWPGRLSIMLPVNFRLG